MASFIQVIGCILTGAGYILLDFDSKLCAILIMCIGFPMIILGCRMHYYPKRKKPSKCTEMPDF